MSIAEDTNRLRRRELLLAAGEDVAEWLAGIAQERFNISAEVKFLDKGKQLDRAVNSYADKVDQFKKKHGFEINDLINNYKIAAITVKSLSSMDVGPLFSISSKDLRESFLFPLATGLFVYRAACILMQVPKEVMLSNVDFHRDMLHCILFDRDVSEEWLSCLMHAKGLAFGMPAKNI